MLFCRSQLSLGERSSLFTGSFGSQHLPLFDIRSVVLDALARGRSMKSSYIVSSVLLCFFTFVTLGVSKSSNNASTRQAQDVVVQGVVQRASRVPLPWRLVTLRKASTGSSTIGTSDSDGQFQFIALEGRYVLTAIVASETATQNFLPLRIRMWCKYVRSD
jgi:hypothetical protein